jgi:hypothetical protein
LHESESDVVVVVVVVVGFRGWRGNDEDTPRTENRSETKTG